MRNRLIPPVAMYLILFEWVFSLNILCAVGQFDFLAIALEPNHLLIKAT